MSSSITQSTPVMFFLKLLFTMFFNISCQDIGIIGDTMRSKRNGLVASNMNKRQKKHKKRGRKRQHKNDLWHSVSRE